MKREIKFRGKVIDHGGLFRNEKDGEWVYSAESFVHTDSGVFIGMYNEEVKVDPETVGQFTGLKDKDGKEIYEGDIIECISSDGTPIRHYVEFCEARGYYAQYIIDGGKMFIWDRNQEAGGISQSYIYECGKYVIGNIYDNPELLKTE